jgi:Cucumopine synthase C-terminal helical bundle domain
MIRKQWTSADTARIVRFRYIPYQPRDSQRRESSVVTLRIRQLDIAWETIGAKVRITLDEGHNADLVEPLWAALPYRTLQGHALVAGECMYHVVPAHQFLYATPDDLIDRVAAPDGTVFCSTLQHLTIKYGRMTEPMPAARVGQVVQQDAQLLAKIGRAVWESVHDNGAPIIAHVSKAVGSGGHRIQRIATDSEVARDLVEAIAAETERVLTDPTDELVAVHRGARPSDTGTKSTVLPTVVFVNGEVRPLGYSSYTGLVRAAHLTDIPLTGLVEMAKILLVKPSEFLGYCGLNTLWDTTKQVIAALGVITTRNDFVALMAHMATYVNALGAWNLQLFPWEMNGSSWDYRPNTGHTDHVR